ncbi:MAG TPA: peroxiredoxin family protein [Chloroflexia bacterium]|nr:peroxiredoxin family protein [Chloroflexia bacterium]
MPQMTTLLRPGAPAPDFRILDSAGHVHTLGRCRRQGRNVALFFFRGTWCRTCRQQITLLSRHYPALTDRGWTIAAITSQTSSAVATFVEKNQVPFPILIDADRAVSKQYGVYTGFQVEGIGAPTVNGPQNATFLIDNAGVLWFAYVGVASTDVPDESTLLGAMMQIERELEVAPSPNTPAAGSLAQGAWQPGRPG